MTKTDLDINDFKNYEDVTIGTLIHILKSKNIDTSNIVEFKEEFQLNPDVELNINGRICENEEVFEELQDIIFHPKNRGKRILLVSDTGTGKSYALTKLIHVFNEKLSSKGSILKHPRNFSVYACPRRALIHNLQGSFTSDGLSVKLTGSDNHSAIERNSIINNNFSFLTTIDHASHIIDAKLKAKTSRYLANNLPTAMLITDETHSLATDASFKIEAVKNYLIAERDVLNMEGISLHVTATPENLHLNEFDMIIHIQQNERQNPFKKAEYMYINQSIAELKDQFLHLMQYTIEQNIEKKLLVFVEDTELIDYYCNQLKKRNINAIGVVSKKDNERLEGELKLIDEGIILDETQVILATTVLSSGVSIVNNTELDETWVLCSSNSLNHELTQLIQMSHRFRNKYETFRVFFQKSSKSRNSKGFFYHELLENNIEKAENSKELVRKIRRNPLKYSITLDQTEQAAGLYTDNEGVLRVLVPQLQSELLQNKKRYNYTNPDKLILELEDRFDCVCEEFELDLDNVAEGVDHDDLRTDNLSSKDVVKILMSDYGMFNRLKREWALYGYNSKKGLMGMIKSRNIKRDLAYFIEYGVDFNIVKQILSCHLQSSKDNPCSYVKDKQAVIRVDAIKSDPHNSLDKQLYELMSERIDLETSQGKVTSYNSMDEIDNQLKKLCNQLIQRFALDIEDTNINIRHFRELLDIELKKSNGKRIRTIQGFKDKDYVLKRYGLSELI